MEANEYTDRLLGHTALPPENVTNHQLYIILLQQNNEIRALTRRAEEQGDELARLTEAFDSAAGVIRFVKIMGMLAGAATAVWGLLKLIKG